MKRKLLLILWVLANIFVIFSLSLYQSGYTLKGYVPAYGKDALKYAPVLYANPDDRPVKVLYELDRHGGISYYYVWPTESTGKPLIDRFYDYVRRLFYGSSADVEPVTVYPKNQTITFESYSHRRVWAKFVDGTCYVVGGEAIENCTVNGTHVKVYVVTWNHLFSLLPQSGLVRVNLTPEPMSPWEYAHYSIFRRANESIREAAIRSLFLAVVVTAVLNLAGYYLLIKRELWRKIRNELKRES
ncbi:hypothetical protein [Thermococcus sp.]